jgi:hypothetical protein
VVFGHIKQYALISNKDKVISGSDHQMARALDGGEWSASRSDHLYLRASPMSRRLNKPKAVLDTVAMRKTSNLIKVLIFILIVEDISIFKI